MSVCEPSLDRLADHWSITLQNIGGLSGMGTLAEYVFTAGYIVDLSKATMIDAHPHAQTRCLLESWHI